MRKALPLLFVAAASACSGEAERTAKIEQALSGTVVISQIYGGGGNSTAVYASDYVELFNRGATSVSLSGWSVQYAAAAGTSWTATALPAKSIPPGGYFLVQLYTGTTGLPLLGADAIGSTNLSAVSGKVALVKSATALTCGASCATATNVLDFVGYGTAINYEGTGPAPIGTVLTADTRNGAGCDETDDNAADFASAAPGPRTSSSTKTTCPTIDAGVDTGSPDTEPLDTGTIDTGSLDTGSADTEPLDTGATVVDSATTDTSMPSDTGASTDSAPTEDAPAESGVDAMTEEDTGARHGTLDLPAAQPACSCRTVGSSSHGGASSALGLALLALVRRRR